MNNFFMYFVHSATLFSGCYHSANSLHPTSKTYVEPIKNRECSAWCGVILNQQNPDKHTERYCFFTKMRLLWKSRINLQCFLLGKTRKTILFLTGTTGDGLDKSKCGTFCLCGHGAAEGSRQGLGLHNQWPHTNRGFPWRKQSCPVKPFTPSSFLKISTF